MAEESKEKLQNDIMKALDVCYDKAVSGLGNLSPSIDEFASQYLEKDSDPQKAAKKMMKNQIAKCTVSGFITGFGGAITMPVTIPANMGSVLYVQMRMIACTAYLAGYDLKSDQVQTFIYACLAGVNINQFIKKVGQNLSKKLVQKGIERIPGKTLVKINQRIGFRLVTKFGEKGVFNLGKIVPGVGAFVNGGLDHAETKIIAKRAYKMFFEGDFSAGDKESVDDVEFTNYDVEDIDVEDGVIEE